MEPGTQFETSGEQAVSAALPGLETRPSPMLEVKGLRKEYATGRGKLVLFDGLSFTVVRASS